MCAVRTIEKIRSRVVEIINLHQEIAGHLKISLDKAIRIGELLAEQKKSLKHGKFISWIKTNLPFTDRTARNYIRLYRKRDKIKTETISDLTLTGAYGLLSAPIIHLKKERQSQHLKKTEEKLQYAKEHPEQIHFGEVRYIKGGAGNWECKETITGQMNGLPFIYTECIDPEYKKLEVNKAPFGLSFPVGQARLKIEMATRDIKRVYDKFGNIIYDAYDFSFNEGVIEMYMPLVKAWRELKKLMDKIENNQKNKGVNHE